MKFIVIDPTAKRVLTREAKEPIEASTVLKSGSVDFGTIAPDIGLIAYEYGLMEGNGPYFALNHSLYSGEVVLFRFDETGETIDWGTKPLPKPLWLSTKLDVESAIAAGLVHRPFTAVNNSILWRWK